jgi:hypothetical protein
MSNGTPKCSLARPGAAADAVHRLETLKDRPAAPRVFAAASPAEPAPDDHDIDVVHSDPPVAARSTY